MIGTIFTYNGVEVTDDRHTLRFSYTISTDEQSFDLQETLTLPVALPQGPTVDRVLKALHLALGISYYKAFIPPMIEHPYEMSASEATFWNDVFINGLGEFMYKNNLTPDQIADFSAQNGQAMPGLGDDVTWQNSALLGIGGGKDSIVAGEILKELGLPAAGFVIATGENRGQAQAVSDVMGLEMFGIERRIDQKIIEINGMPGAYNGHVPISLVFALVGCLLAICKGSRYVIVANEASASIPQLQNGNQTVNHQWSKSLEFEKSFQEFVHAHIAHELSYFSLIRPLSSIAVAKIFGQYPQYFEVFTSDNSVFAIKQEAREHPRWSTRSPKTLSSYILLAPWMSDEDLVIAFGKNYMQEAELEPLLTALLGLTDEIVLDCVGTPDELRLSLSELNRQQRFADSILMQMVKNRGILHDTFDIQFRAMLQISKQHAIPVELQENIVELLRSKLA